MKRVAVLEHSAMHTVGLVWEWTVYVGRRKAGTFSVTSKQGNYDGPSTRLRGTYRLRKAADILRAIAGLWCQMGEEVFGPEEQVEVAQRLCAFDPQLACEITTLDLRTVLEDFGYD